jgi:hypothetical protein
MTVDFLYVKEDYQAVLRISQQYLVQILNVFLATQPYQVVSEARLNADKCIDNNVARI